MPRSLFCYIYYVRNILLRKFDSQNTQESQTSIWNVNTDVRIFTLPPPPTHPHTHLFKCLLRLPWRTSVLCTLLPCYLATYTSFWRTICSVVRRASGKPYMWVLLHSYTQTALSWDVAPCLQGSYCPHIQSRFILRTLSKLAFFGWFPYRTWTN
jgi:hypothetical protein